MVVIVIVAILWIIALAMVVVGKIKYQNINGHPAEFSLRPWSLIPGLLGWLILILTSITVVGAGKVGIPVTFGKVGNGLGSGAHLVPPWTHVSEVNVRLQNYTMSGVGGEGAVQGNDAVPVNTKDQVSVTVDSTVLFQLVRANVKDVYVKLGNDYVNQEVRPIVRSAIRDAAVQYNAVDLATNDRSAFQAAAQQQIEENLGKFHITVNSLQIRDMGLPGNIQTAVNAKVQASQEAEAQKFVLQSVQQKAQQRIAEAHGIKDAQTIIQQTLSPLYLEYEYIQTLAQLAKSPNTTFLFVPNNPSGLPNFQLPITPSTVK